jgi:hypothetical protein
MDIGMSNDGPSKMPCFIMIFKAFQAESVFFEYETKPASRPNSAWPI